jgi:hypothetical protein
VQRWRERHALFLPRFTNQRIAELSGTLAYPADGSPHAGNANSRPS